MKVSRMCFLVALLAGLPTPTASAPIEAGARPADVPPLGTVSLADRAFLADALLDELLGQAMGEQAERRPGGARFAVHALQMRDRHGLQADAWRGIAAVHGVRAPAVLDADRIAVLVRLGQVKDADYERAFARTALSLHLQAVERLEMQARAGDDPALREAAEKAVAPALVLVRASRALWNEVAPVGL